MDEQEMLKLAAKAAGIEIRFVSTVSQDFRRDLGELPYTCKPHQHPDERKRFSDWGTPWNPLTDDGDALRLAVKLNLCVSQWTRTSYQPHVMVGYNTGPDSGANLTEDHGDDPYAATRRAIVRAAAAIGSEISKGDKP